MIIIHQRFPVNSFSLFICSASTWISVHGPHGGIPISQKLSFYSPSGPVFPKSPFPFINASSSLADSSLHAFKTYVSRLYAIEYSGQQFPAPRMASFLSISKAQCPAFQTSLMIGIHHFLNHYACSSPSNIFAYRRAGMRRSFVAQEIIFELVHPAW